MSNDMDLRTSYKKFIQDLPQLLADKGPEQVYALYKAENYGSLRAGGFRGNRTNGQSRTSLV